MTTRNDVERLRAANARIVAMARADLTAFFRTLDPSEPDALVAALMEFTPALVREYGDLAAAVAAEWYEELRSQHPALSPYSAQLASPQASPAVQGSVGYATADVASDPKALTKLLGALQRHISYSTRETIRRNVAGDPARPRYARVPTGARTCAFCEMLASRGFVYASEASAGDRARDGFGDDFHDDCDCQVVPEFDAERHHIEGYDPDAMYERYREARAAAAGSTPSDVVAAMRRLFPEQYTDGLKPV